MSDFADNLAQGKIAEGLISRWLIARGNCVMAAYEIETAHGKGPQLFAGHRSFAAPDLLVFSHNGVRWIESKHKSIFSWHRISATWVTGIDTRHYEDYLSVANATRLPVWLLFYHRESAPARIDIEKGCPPTCPTGLYGGELFALRERENTSAAGCRDQRRTETRPAMSAQATVGLCGNCDGQNKLLTHLHGDKGGPLMCLTCGMAWHIAPRAKPYGRATGGRSASTKTPSNVLGTRSDADFSEGYIVSARPVRNLSMAKGRTPATARRLADNAHTETA